MDAELPSIETFPLHQQELMRSSHVGYVSGMSHLKRGWMIRKLAKSYGTSAGKYSHCLYDGQRGFRQLSDTIMKEMPDPDPNLPLLALDETMYALVVPFDQKDAVKAAGAVWMSDFRRWCCMPMEEEKFDQWLFRPICTVRNLDDLMKLNVPKGEHEKAKAAGAFWMDSHHGTGWYGLRGMRNRLIEWIY